MLDQIWGCLYLLTLVSYWGEQQLFGNDAGLADPVSFLPCLSLVFLLIPVAIVALVISLAQLLKRQKKGDQSEQAWEAQFALQVERRVAERTVRLQQALEFEAMLKRITDKVRDSLDENLILATALRELVQVLGVNYCNTALYHDGQARATIALEFSEEGFKFKNLVLPVDEFPVIYQQLLWGEYLQFCTALPIYPHIRATILLCPIFDSQEVLGDLLLFKPEFLSFDELEIRLVRQVANQCAIAIRQARLYHKAQTQVTELERLNYLKDDFLSTVSHELRTPVSNMKMAIFMLKAAPDDRRREQYLNVLQTECDREIDLINDLLDLQRLEAASYTLAPTCIALYDCLQTLIEPFWNRTRDRQQTLTVSIPTDLPCLLSDRTCLERILAELLNNACKYTAPGGEINFQVKSVPVLSYSSLKAHQFTFTVKNQAEIASEELSQIFNKFYRIPHADRWKQGGTGLGLALVQKLVHHLGGQVNVGSYQGWTQFEVSLITTSPLPELAAQ